MATQNDRLATLAPTETEKENSELNPSALTADVAAKEQKLRYFKNDDQPKVEEQLDTNSEYFAYSLTETVLTSATIPEEKYNNDLITWFRRPRKEDDLNSLQQMANDKQKEKGLKFNLVYLGSKDPVRGPKTARFTTIFAIYTPLSLNAP